MANEPSAHSVCSATARERTHGGALVCVAVLKVDITAIHAAPPSDQRDVHDHGTRRQAATSITAREDDAADRDQPLQPEARAQPPEDQAGRDRAGAQAAHQQAEAGGAQAELALRRSPAAAPTAPSRRRCRRRCARSCARIVGEWRA